MILWIQVISILNYSALCITIHMYLGRPIYIHYTMIIQIKHLEYA